MRKVKHIFIYFLILHKEIQLLENKKGFLSVYSCRILTSSHATLVTIFIQSTTNTTKAIYELSRKPNDVQYYYRHLRVIKKTE